MHHHPDDLLRIALEVHRSNIAAAEHHRLMRGVRSSRRPALFARHSRHPVSR